LLDPIGANAVKSIRDIEIPVTMTGRETDTIPIMSDDFYRYNVIASAIRSTVNPDGD
jgi:hypothetical protein